MGREERTGGGGGGGGAEAVNVSDAHAGACPTLETLKNRKGKKVDRAYISLISSP